MFPFFNDLYSSSPQGSGDQKNQKDLISAGCDYCPVKAVIAHIRQTKTSLFFSTYLLLFRVPGRAPGVKNIRKMMKNKKFSMIVKGFIVIIETRLC